jgi:hypothetical protein
VLRVLPLFEEVQYQDMAFPAIRLLVERTGGIATMQLALCRVL